VLSFAFTCFLHCFILVERPRILSLEDYLLRFVLILVLHTFFTRLWKLNKIVSWTVYLFSLPEATYAAYRSAFAFQSQ
jgi:hypothetical protein